MVTGPWHRVLFAALLLALVPAALPARAAADFSRWLEALRSEAAAQGISQATLNAALSDLTPIPRVIELDRRQPERTLTFDEYLERVVSETRIAQARREYLRHRPLLEEIGRRYGVPPRFIVALWGIESSFGHNTGSYRVIPALATLAYDGRRSTFFRSELLAALRILDQGHVTPEDMRGSWAGAMGQNQFMPSSFLQYAVDHDGDGRRDIWRSHADVFASTANYLARAGWDAAYTWGREVHLPPGFDPALAGLDTRKPLAEWQALGVRRRDGGDLPAVAISASLVLPGGPGGPAFLVYDNYRAILRWNRSTYFATAVGLLADAIGHTPDAGR